MFAHNQFEANSDQTPIHSDLNVIAVNRVSSDDHHLHRIHDHFEISRSTASINSNPCVGFEHEDHSPFRELAFGFEPEILRFPFS